MDRNFVKVFTFALVAMKTDVFLYIFILLNIYKYIYVHTFEILSIYNINN